jgi:PAS domain-containing protein
VPDDKDSAADDHSAQDALRESEKYYRLLLESANDAVYVHEVRVASPTGS